MKTDLLDIIVCPVCKGPLDLTADEIAPQGSADAGEVLAGTLACASCGAAYPISDGIPNLLPPDIRETEFATDG